MSLRFNFPARNEKFLFSKQIPKQISDQAGWEFGGLRNRMRHGRLEKHFGAGGWMG